MKSILIFMLSIAIASMSQVLLKKSANQIRESAWKEYINSYVIGAYALLLVSTILTMIAYKELALSKGVILESISYILIAFLSYFLLKEKITKQKMIGIVMIISGIIIVSIG